MIGVGSPPPPKKKGRGGAGRERGSHRKRSGMGGWLLKRKHMSAFLVIFVTDQWDPSSLSLGFIVLAQTHTRSYGLGLDVGSGGRDGGL